MRLGQLLHAPQKDLSLFDKLVDTVVWEQTKDLDQAKQSAQHMLKKNMASDKVLPCLGKIKKCNGSADFFWDELRNPCKREGYSQGTQACQLDKIFEHIGTTNKYYVEYGFNKNTQCSGSGPNTCKLWSVHGWTGLLLDGDNENLEINLHAHYLYSTNAASILKQ
jgi:hypothetical protein